MVFDLKLRSLQWTRHDNHEGRLAMLASIQVNAVQQSKDLKYAFDMLQESTSLPSAEVTSHLEHILSILEESNHDWLYIRLLEICLYHKSIDFAERAFQNMLRLNIPFSNNFFSSFITSLVDLDAFDTALRVIDKAFGHGFMPSVHSFTPLLKSAGSAGRAKQVLHQMEVCGVERNVISFTTAIKSLDASADWRGALELLDWMRCLGIAPNQISYCCAITLTSKDHAGEKERSLCIVQRNSLIETA